MRLASNDHRAMLGTGQDTMLAHINPMEAAILKLLGGRGDRNPRTGLPRYDVDGGGDATGNDPMSGGGEYAGIDSGMAAPAQVDIRDVGVPSPNAGTLSPGQMGRSLDPLGPQNVDIRDVGVPSPYSGSLTGTPYGIGGEAFGKEGFLGPPDKTGFPINLNPQAPPITSPFSRAAYELTSLLGNSIGRPINERFGGNALARDTSGMGAQGYTEGTSGDAMRVLADTQPVANPAPSYMRPAEMSPPSGLGIPAGLSDLQKRAIIATHGTQGGQGQFRSQDAMRYYANLIARALIGQNGTPASSPDLLPVETGYIKQQYGKVPGTDTAALLNDLRSYWS